MAATRRPDPSNLNRRCRTAPVPPSHRSHSAARLPPSPPPSPFPFYQRNWFLALHLLMSLSLFAFAAALLFYDGLDDASPSPAPAAPLAKDQISKFS